MKPSIDEKRDWWPAPCRGARRLLAITITVSGLILLTTAADLLWEGYHRHETDIKWMKPFALSAPALWPAGSPMRHPETVHPAVDLRFTPGMEATP